MPYLLHFSIVFLYWYVSIFSCTWGSDKKFLVYFISCLYILLLEKKTRILRSSLLVHLFQNLHRSTLLLILFSRCPWSILQLQLINGGTDKFNFVILISVGIFYIAEVFFFSSVSQSTVMMPFFIITTFA